MITEQESWQILQNYAKEVSQLETTTLLAVFAIGSLPGGYFRPGQSDLDAVLIVKDGSEKIWGSGKNISPSLEKLNQKYQDLCGTGTGFEGFANQESKLLIRNQNGLLLLPQLNARLKLQSRLLYGDYDLAKIPMPTRADWLADVVGLESQWQAQGGDAQLLTMDAYALVNHALLKIKQYLILVQDRVIFNKHDLIMIWSELKQDKQARLGCRLMRHVIAGKSLNDVQLHQMLDFVVELRQEINCAIFA